MLGSGVAPVRELLDAGVNVSLGSDGSCSTLTTSMLNVVGSAAAVAKLRGSDPARWLSAREALHAGTLAGGRALGFGESLGSLRVGALADLVAYRLDSVTFTPRNDPLRQLVYAERGAGLDFSMVAGERRRSRRGADANRRGGAAGRDRGRIPRPRRSLPRRRGVRSAAAGRGRGDLPALAHDADPQRHAGGEAALNTSRAAKTPPPVPACASPYHFSSFKEIP